MSEQPVSDPIEWIKRLTESYRQIRFGRGVVGKTGHVMLALMGVWAVIVWRLSGAWVDIALIGAGLVATGTGIWWVRATQDFAQRNPAQALLEGAEFLEYQKFEAQAKGLIKLPPSPVVEGHPSSLISQSGSTSG